jgi:hypothetical protein
MAYPISHTRKDTFIRTLSFKDSLGAAINLTGANVKFTIKTNVSDTNPLLQATAVVPSPATGVGTVTFTAAQMDLAEGVYWYDIQLTDAASTVTTVLKDSFTVTYNVT